MKIDHRPEKTTIEPGKTVYEFNDDDVREALLAFAASKGQKVPGGNTNVRIRDGSYSRGSSEEPRPLATLTVTHAKGGDA